MRLTGRAPDTGGMQNNALIPLVAQGQMLSWLWQGALGAMTEKLGDTRWEVDLAEGRLSFVNRADNTRRIDAGIDLVASIAPGPKSTLWGWGHPQGRPNGVAALIRDSGHPGLDIAEFPFPAEVSDVDGYITQTSHEIGVASVAARGRGPYYSAPMGGGSRAVFALEVPALEPPAVADLMSTFIPMMSSTPPLDARTALWFAATRLGWAFEWTQPEFAAATIADPTGSATFRFDAQGRVIGLETDLARPHSNAAA